MTDLAPIGPLSPSVGDYLKAIWELAETGTASTKQIAERLSVAPASVTNMLGRLRERGLVDYEAYQRAVPAWLPRLRPWEPGERDEPGAG